MKKIIAKAKRKGQTTLEYALVIGVIVVGAIVMGQKFFGKEGQASKIFESAIENSAKTAEFGSPE